MKSKIKTENNSKLNKKSFSNTILGPTPYWDFKSISEYFNEEEGMLLK